MDSQLGLGHLPKHGEGARGGHNEMEELVEPVRRDRLDTGARPSQGGPFESYPGACAEIR